MKAIYGNGTFRAYWLKLSGLDIFVHFMLCLYAVYLSNFVEPFLASIEVFAPIARRRVRH